MPDRIQNTPVLLSALPSHAAHTRVAAALCVLLVAGLLGTLPFAQIAWVPFPAFILVQESLLSTNDLITAALLFGQYSISRTPALNRLAGGYLFTALIVIPHEYRADRSERGSERQPKPELTSVQQLLVHKGALRSSARASKGGRKPSSTPWRTILSKPVDGCSVELSVPALRYPISSCTARWAWFMATSV